MSLYGFEFNKSHENNAFIIMSQIGKHLLSCGNCKHDNNI